MTPEKQRILIAEACGWKKMNGIEVWHHAEKGKNAIPSGGILHKKRIEMKLQTGTDFILPDYIEDLNMIHEAVMSMKESPGLFWTDYNLALLKICGGYSWEATNATAAQRAEAFLRTIGKWEAS
ncbi:MAG: hypothetical protein V4563_13995 [Pseudomonadota bacterium]